MLRAQQRSLSVPSGPDRMYMRVVGPLMAMGLATLAGVDGAGGATLGQYCGGRLNIGCDAGLFCDLRAGTCGTFDAEGTCVRIPRLCVQRSVGLRSVWGCN